MQLTAPEGYELIGAVVRRGFSMGGARVPPGRLLPAARLNSMNAAARRIMLRENYLTPVYARPNADGPAERYIFHRGSGRYDVVEGRLLNSEPLTREAAEALCNQGGSH